MFMSTCKIKIGKKIKILNENYVKIKLEIWLFFVPPLKKDFIFSDFIFRVPPCCKEFSNISFNIIILAIHIQNIFWIFLLFLQQFSAEPLFTYVASIIAVEIMCKICRECVVGMPFIHVRGNGSGSFIRNIWVRPKDNETNWPLAKSNRDTES